MIVVTGAGGQLGRLVAQALAERISPQSVTLGTRDPAKIADLAAQGFRTAIVDFDAPETLEKAFAGAEIVLIISGDAPVETRIRQHRAAIDAAKTAKAGRVVYTSFTGATPGSLFPFAAIHADTEAWLTASGLPFTILRINQYAENINGAVAAARATGVLSLPGANGKVAHIRRDDVAAAIAGALTGNGHAGKVYEMTGPEALDLHDIAQILSASWGREITAAEMEPTEFERMLLSRGAPPFVAEAVVGIRKAAAAGEHAAVSRDSERLAGRPAASLSSIIAAIPAAG